jgi:hypothetical protein
MALNTNPNKKYICYEDLMNDTHKEFYNIITFITNEKPCTKSINYSVKENEFYNLKNKAERSNDILLSKTDKNDPNSAKIRKGKIGGYRDELKQSTIEYIDNYIKKNLNKDINAFEKYL